MSARSRLPLVLVGFALLAVVLLAARGTTPVPYGAGPAVHSRPAASQSATATGEPAVNSVVGVASAVGTVGVLIAVLAGLGLATAMALTVLWSARDWRPRRRGPSMVERAVDDPGSADQPAGQALLRGVRQALTELRQRAAGPPSDAVVAAWLRLEEAASASGTARLPHQTPSEFTAALLSAHQVDQGGLAELRRLYQRARFGAAGQVSAADAEAAGRALETLVGDLSRSRR